ncbi:potassium voltage-gated channel subfamily H member 8-like isoform X3 [Portunus trituberculatus]|uniref:potassium voltage-gated channel subfamily H member 8-like isoform X3 n=1 Tax=Portunus trituberculatus TaxID=210409 RepID=UPI001E1CD68F|nr:potassium voltage-gated channel subfamily H member 8-like isoform X3 [Portunus trituberculatus]
MPARRGLLAPQNTFLDTIATRFDGTHSNFVLGNAQVCSLYPIVYCSDGFCELTGYARAQIMQKGCACKFLYGPDTMDEHKVAIEKALETKSELKMEVLFYKKNGAAFWCLLDIVPIKNEKREVVLFLASHKDVTSSKMEEVSFYPGYENDENENLDPEAPSAAKYGRRRSRAVLYQLSGHYTQDKGKNKLKLNNQNLLQPHSAAPLPEYKTASIQKSRFILTHYGMLKTCWDLVILLATFYVAVMVPYNAAFLDQTQQDKPTIVPDVVVEALFFVDIILNFRTTFVNKKGEVVLSPIRIATHYFKGWFVLDLLAAIPFDLLLAADVYSSATNIHLLKLTRLLRLARLLQKMDRYYQYSALILTLLMLSFTLVAHWLACVWYAIAEPQVNLWEEGEPRIGWIFDLAHRLETEVRNVTIVQKYLTALYFTCSSLTSVGFGNVSANTNHEKIFSIVTMLIGALMHATVFGNVTSIIQRMYLRRSLYQTKWRDLKDFLAINQIPKELRQRMQDYFQTMWSLNQGIDINETLKEFPEELRGDISMHIHREILSLPIFETASQGCLKLLSLHIRNNFCAPGEYLVHRGDVLHYIFYLCNGSMEVVMDDMVVAILGKGDLVGSDVDEHLRNGGDTVVKSSCDVKALTYCDLKSIFIPGLMDVLKMYLEYQQEFANDIKHDLTYNLREGYDSEQQDMEIGSAKNILPSISEDDEERGSEEEDKSPVSTSPRSPLHSRTTTRNEEDVGSPRWGHRSRERSGGTPVRGALKTLSPTRLHHRSNDELRGDDQAKVQLEKLDTQVTTLHSDVSGLTQEVRSALQLLQSISHNIGGIDNEGGEVEHGSCYTVASNDGRRLTCGNVAATTGASGGSGSNSYMQENRLAPMCRSSPSVFAATYRESRGSSTLGRHRTRNVSTQTDLPINVPVAVLEAFVLAHRSRVLQLLGVPDVPDESCESPSATQPQASSPAASEQGATESEETSTSSSENLTSSSEQDHSLHGPRSPPGKNSVQNQKPSITIQPAAASLGGETRNNNNNRTPNAPPLEMYQLTNLRNWNPTPRLNKSFISSSRSTGSLRDILSNNVKNQTRQSPSQESGACPALVHNQVPKSETDADKTLVHYTCASNCPKTDLICFSEVNHTMTRSTSMPVSAFKIQPNPSSSPSASSHPHSSRAPAAPIPQSPGTNHHERNPEQEADIRDRLLAKDQKQ